jgi:D-alanyl-lipoteichoic acid acyltransferase DltB (MBOAT superfamily)
MSTLASRLAPKVARRATLAECAAIWLQLALAIVLIGLFHLLDRAFFYRMGPLILVGFAIHCQLPRAARAWFFTALSVASLWLILGLWAGSWLLLAGLSLMLICHLPIRLSGRLAILAAVILLFALVRVDYFGAPESADALQAAHMGMGADAVQDAAELEPSVRQELEGEIGPPAPWHWSFWPSGAIWPVAGAMFMLRLIIYLYDLEHQTKPVSWAYRISYFFMLPNVLCMLFPIVDFGNFTRNHYDDPDERKIYQIGTNWIFRGCTHLIMYRIIYLYLVIDAAEVQSVGQLLQYIYVPFLLYLRVSGEFHLYVGILRLFGFNLPETHHLYYFSTSFTDFWRRTNIYWKDFMQKVFYFPAYFRLRSLGNTQALVLSTCFVFVVTWALHAYLFFWIQGTFLLHANDVLFWTILGVLVVINSLWEIRYPPVRSLSKTSQTPKELLIKGLKGLATFTTICLLWSFWSEKSVETWLSAWSVLGNFQASDLMALAPWLLAGVAFVLLAAWAAREGMPELPPFWRAAGLEMACLAGLIFLGWNPVTIVVGDGVALASTEASQTFTKLVRGFREEKLNRQDYAKLQRGYYENLAAVGQHSPELAAMYRQKPKGFVGGAEDSKFIRTRKGIPTYELIPSVKVTRDGELYTINSHGMRDRERTLEKKPEEPRIALVGASPVMGLGVGDEETFHYFLEEAVSKGGAPRFEFLNFGVQGYTLLEYPAVVEEKVFAFQPDVMFYVAHHDEVTRTLAHVASAIGNKVAMPYDDLNELLVKIGITPETGKDQVYRLLTQHQDEVIRWGNKRLVAECQAKGVLPVWVHVPFPVPQDTERELNKLKQLALECGFVVLDLADVFDGQDLDKLRISAWDLHANKEGNRLIAEGLLKRLANDPEFQALRDRAGAAVAGSATGGA